MKKLLYFLKNVQGATAIEYGLLASFISVAIIAAVFAFGTELNNLYTTLTGLFSP